ncbi:MAG: tetratricopeptide repeat protein [Rhodospirillales bacterium]
MLRKPARARGGGEAETKLKQAIKAFQKGDFRQAKKIVLRLEKSLGAVPQLTHLNGFIELELGNYSAAINALKVAKASFAADIDVINALGVALRRSGEAGAAIQEFKQATAMAPDRPDILANLGNAFSDTGNLSLAVEAYTQSLSLAPNQTEVRHNLAVDLVSLGDEKRARQELDELLTQNPEDAKAMFALAKIHINACEFTDARRLLETLRTFDEVDPNVDACFAAIRLVCGNVRESLAVLARVNQTGSSSPDLAASWVLSRNYLPDITPHDFLAAAKEWAATFAVPALPKRPNAGPHADGKIRLGVLSGKLHSHPCSQFLLPFLRNRARERVSVEIIARDVKQDAISTEIQELADSWQDVSLLGREHLISHVAGRELDLLISPTGLEEGGLLTCFTARLAPTQIVGFGFTGTTGLSAMDGVLADRFHIPEGAEGGYVETVLRMPEGYVAYIPPSYLPALSGKSDRTGRPPIFGCFNNLAKLCDGTIALWARVLNAVPDACLVLKAGPLGDAGVRRDFAGRFAAAGVDPDRLDLRPSSPHDDLLATYNEIDLALDPIAYSGGLTTLEALWMGVPVLTLPGETFTRRHSLSHLSVSGLDMFVARNADDYVRIAATFAEIMAGAGLDRAGVRDAIARSPLSDGARYAQDFCDLMDVFIARD